ncbi:hypothetical protein FZEAL_2282 [Fusarium zealandicum]|uniref:Ubiquitin-like domain-containing protein n=1 Tax=Fusarium zealandicum TaxID=1053134 RepID=A0A8H4UR52_9HYPO|nr:hypothetical protein FZEAL_2282 [Fusarium zealandicum]
MASKPPTTRPDDDGTTVASSVEEQTVSLQIVSPSVGVNRPLLFPGLPATTTVKQLKDKIRQTLPLRPADEHQRLIHRGRAIVRDMDTLLDIFGADAIRNPEQQTIHLVIRDTHDSQSSTPTVPPVAAPVAVPGPARGPSPTASAPPTNPPRQQAQHAHGHPFGYQIPPGVAWRNSMPPTSNPFPQPRMPSPSPSHTPEQAAAFQHHHQNMTQWLNNIQREAMARALNQNQRTRAQMGMRGVGDNATAGNTPVVDNSGRASPAPGQTIYREHVGPNGHTYQVETVIRTMGRTQQAHGNGAMSPAEVQNIIRSADGNQTTLGMTSAMQRSASSTSLHNRNSAQSGLTTPGYSTPGSMVGSGRDISDPSSARLAGTAAPGNSQSRQGPEVYILSSPDGPRALLFNNASSETYYTPRLRTQTSFPQLRHPSVLSSAVHDAQNQMRARHHHHHHHHHPRSHGVPQPLSQIYQSQAQAQPQPQPQHQQHQPTPPPQQEQPRQGQAQVQVQAQQDQVAAVAPLLHRGNPPVAALPPLLMQLWPQIWLLFRLALFVWFFTSPTATWSRWLTIIVIAVFIFVLSTGVLNGVPDHIWRPLGRHLENLIPLEQPRRHRGAAGLEQQNNQARQEPNPAEMARRLVVQHHGPESWVLSQVRRLERAGLLFLASIAPGVAERHIANLEAAARAERERREAEAAAAAAAAAAENNENNENNETGENRGDGDDANTAREQADQQNQPEHGQDTHEEQGVQENNQQNEPAREQLIPV